MGDRETLEGRQGPEVIPLAVRSEKPSTSSRWLQWLFGWLDDPEPASVRGILFQILTRLCALEAQGKLIMSVLDTLTEQVAATTTAEQSAITLLNGLAAALAAAGTDPVKLQALQDALKTNTDALAAAVIADTPTSV